MHRVRACVQVGGPARKPVHKSVAEGTGRGGGRLGSIRALDTVAGCGHENTSRELKKEISTASAHTE